MKSLILGMETCVWAASVCRQRWQVALLIVLAGMANASAALTVSAVQAARPGRDVTAKDLAQVREIPAFAVSPDGRSIAYQVREPRVQENDYVLRWFLADAQGKSPPRELAEGGQIDLMTLGNGWRGGEFTDPALAWSADSRVLYFTRRERGARQIWRVRREGGGAEQVSHNAADVLVFSLSADNAKVFFTVGRERAAMQKADEEEGARGFLARDEATFEPLGSAHSTVPGAYPWPLCGDFKVRLPVEETRKCAQTLWVRELAGGVERVATAAEHEEYQALLESGGAGRQPSDQSFVLPSARPSPQGDRIAWLDEESPELARGVLPLQRIAVRTRGNAKKTRCSAEPCGGQVPRIRTLGWDPSGTEVIFSRRDGPGRQSMTGGSVDSLYAWNPRKNSVRSILRDEGVFLWGSTSDECELRGRRVICVRQGWTQPSQIVAIDINDGRMQVLVDPNPQFQGLATTRIEKIVWNDGRGSQVYGQLLYPKGYQPGKRYPLVVIQYSSNGFILANCHFREYPVGLFPQDGIMVLTTNAPRDWMRLAKESDPVVATQKIHREFQVEHPFLVAVERGLDELEAAGLIDPKRIGITGLSAGASTVDDALVFTRRFAAAASAYSNSSPIIYYFHAKSYRKTMRQNYGGKPFAQGLLQWQKDSVGLNAQRIDVPLMITVADREYTDTVQNYIDLKDAGKPVELYIFPDEYHTKWQPVHHYNIYRRTAQWFKFWLRDEEDADPVDPDQYVRWRQLRSLQQENLRAKGSVR